MSKGKELEIANSPRDPKGLLPTVWKFKDRPNSSLTNKDWSKRFLNVDLPIFEGDELGLCLTKTGRYVQI